MKKSFLLSLFLFSAMLLNAQPASSGYVYDDSNRNGKKDRNEKGIPGVAVSNGQEVILTDSDGKYELPVGTDQIIFVIKPAGYTVPTDSNMLPSFYYIHKPSGSPELGFPGVAPTGKLPKSTDFPLFKTGEDDQFSVLLFGDPQAYTLEEIDFFRLGIVDELEGIKNISFGLSVGDLVGDNLDLFKPYIQAVKNIGVPWYNVFGNHDMNFDATADSLADETFEAHFGPASYAMNYGKTHFIILDDILYPDPRGGKGYWGGFREDQMDFIENYVNIVPTDHLIVVAAHIPLNDEDGDTFRDEDRQWLFNILEKHPHTLSLSAHTHMQKHVFFTEKEGWKQDKPHHHFNVGTTSGSWYTGRHDENGIPVSTMRDGTPKGYAFLHFDGNGYRIEYKAAGKPKEYQMSIYAPKVVEYQSRSWPGIFVNFFIGHAEDEVMFRVDNGDWKKMNYTETFDPTYLADVMEWDFTDELIPGKRPSPPRYSKHLWNASVPTNLEPGMHIIEIKATDMFGNLHYGKKEYKILEK